MRIGIDVGGTKIEGIAIDRSGATLCRKRVSTPDGNYADTIDTIVSLVLHIESVTGRTGSVGVGIPGTVSPATGLVKNANSTCLIGKPLDGDLCRALGRDVRVANDADCFALSEATDGAGAGYSTVFGVILGTGVGGGLVIGGALVSGPNAIAGEWGHNRLPVPEDRRYPPADAGGGTDRACYCGRTGCIETYLSGPGLSREYFARTGKTMSPGQISAAAEQGDTLCEAVLREYEQNLAIGLSIVINIVDPAVIVLGGGLSNLERLYANVPRLLAAHVFSDTVRTVLLPPEHGDSSGVRGAAWLWPA
tara:strand:- start:24931 stop:25851 length:921 start_codon:yes stop_codon:yes gene_type:complete